MIFGDSASTQNGIHWGQDKPMHFDALQKFFATSPAVRLIRSPHAFWIVDFLYQQFKVAGKITRPHSELAGELDRYLDQLASDRDLSEVKSDSREKADTYLAAWCSGTIGWLKRFVSEDSTEPSYQLTSEFEKALSFVERASREASFVGTESRLRTILEVLGSVVAGVSEDPQIRLQQLEQQRAQLDREIARIKAAPNVLRMNETQVRERFALAAQQLQQLKSEFRAVEDRFKEITRGVQQRILAADSRGDILQFALDSEDMLKHGDQGRSFFEFLRLLHSPESQDRIAELVNQLSEIEALASEQEELSALRGMVPTLIAEAEKILRTTQHLSLALRRLLDSRSTRHHQQLAHVLREILGAAARRSEDPPSDLGIDVEVELEIQCPVDRPFWSATEPFEDVELQLATINPMDQAAALQQLVSLERLDWHQIRQNISVITESRGEVTLASLLDHFPLQAGAIEVLGYLQVAYEDGHRIDRTRSLELKIKPRGDLRGTLNLPNVVFLPKEGRVLPAPNRTRVRSRGNQPRSSTTERSGLRPPAIPTDGNRAN